MFKFDIIDLHIYPRHHARSPLEKARLVHPGRHIFLLYISAFALALHFIQFTKSIFEGDRKFSLNLRVKNISCSGLVFFSNLTFAKRLEQKLHNVAG